ADDMDMPEEQLTLDERRQLVKAVVDQMPPKLSEILILAYYHKFPYRDIAEIIEVPLGTVKSRLHAAVAYFGEQYRAVVENQSEGRS
ncbi:MAG: sigma-70 family RNA polymerase sigma factor, partial [Acidobacteriota bacterium]